MAIPRATLPSPESNASTRRGRVRAHLSEMDIVDEVNGECLSFLGQLQRQVEDLQRNQLNMQNEIELLRHDRDLLSERCASLERAISDKELIVQNEIELLKSRCSSLEKHSTTLDKSVQVLKHDTKWEYSAQVMSDSYWFWSESHDDADYVSEVNRFLNNMKEKTIYLRRIAYDDNGFHQVKLGVYLENMVMYDDAFDLHWKEFCSSILLLPWTLSGLDLSISNIQLTPEIIRAISDASSGRLNGLILQSNDFTEPPDCVFEIGELIKENCALTSFQMQYNDIGLEEARMLGDALSHCRHHRNKQSHFTVQIQDCCSDDDGQNGYELLCKLIAQEDGIHSPGYDQIDLKNNGIQTLGQTHLSECLESGMIELGHLDLQNNRLNDEDAISIANALRYNREETLRISLRGNLITETGWNALMNVCYNPSSIGSVVESNHTCRIGTGHSTSLFVNLYGNNIGYNLDKRLSAKL